MMLPSMLRCVCDLDACKTLVGWSSEDEDGQAVRLIVNTG